MPTAGAETKRCWLGNHLVSENGHFHCRYYDRAVDPQTDCADCRWHRGLHMMVPGLARPAQVTPAQPPKPSAPQTVAVSPQATKEAAIAISQSRTVGPVSPPQLIPPPKPQPEIPGRYAHALSMRPPATRVSLVIPAFNEGRYLLPTIESAWRAGATEIIVVDDASEDGAASPRALPGDVQVIRHRTSWGVTASRNHGFMACSHFIIACADGHTIWEREKALLEMADAAKSLSAIIVAPCTPMAHAAPADPNHYTAYGGWLKLFSKHGAYFVPLHREKPTERYTPITGLFSGAYCLTRSTWNRMSGWPVLYRYGYAEQAYSLWAYFTATPLLIDAEANTFHRIKAQRCPGGDDGINKGHAIAHWTVFNAETFKDYWWPMIQARHGWATIDEILEPWMREQRDRFQRVKAMSDQDFFLQVIARQKRSLPEFYPDRERDASYD